MYVIVTRGFNDSYKVMKPYSIGIFREVLDYICYYL